jgi:hypothetical protein
VHELTGARQSGKDVKQIIAKLNPVLRGWGNYLWRHQLLRKAVRIPAARLASVL